MRRQFTLIGSILVGCLIIGLLFSSVTVSQVASTPPPSPPVSGRYQAMISDSPNAYTKVLVCDTATGYCWIHSAGKPKWVEIGSPADVKKVAD